MHKNIFLIIKEIIKMKTQILKLVVAWSYNLLSIEILTIAKKYFYVVTLNN